jgi:hypothetical protein
VSSAAAFPSREHAGEPNLDSVSPTAHAITIVPVPPRQRDRNHVDLATVRGLPKYFTVWSRPRRAVLAALWQDEVADASSGDGTSRRRRRGLVAEQVKHVADSSPGRCINLENGICGNDHDPDEQHRE